MKKCFILISLISFTLFAISCKDSKDDPTPELKKVTKVSVLKNSDNSSAQSISITYNQSGQIANIKVNNDRIDDYSYDGNTLVVNSIKTSNGSELSKLKKVRYQISKNLITHEEESLYNSYLNNQEYISNIYEYQYARNRLGETVWSLARWPLEDGTYQTAASSTIGEYIWENQNVIRFRYLPSSIMEFEYMEGRHPSNFPYRIFRSLRPIDLNTISPIHLLMGDNNRNLLKRAYWYNVPDATNLCAEYLFSYNVISDYITEMTITEKIYAVNGASPEENMYTFKFEYNE